MHTGTQEAIIRPFRFTKILQLSILSSCLTAPGSVAAATAGGDQYDDTVWVSGQELKLNGAGVRHKLIFPVYSAGLYLPEKNLAPVEIYSAAMPKRMRLVMQRRVNADEFSQAFLIGIQQNSDHTERGKLVSAINKFSRLFVDVPVLKKGDVLVTDFVPGKGTIFQFNGSQIGETIVEPLFYAMLLKIWLGDKPADAQLKSALLGKGNGA